MPRFRSKPVDIQAEQWFPGKEIEGVRRFKMEDFSDAWYAVIPGGSVQKLTPGDWLVRDSDGNGYLVLGDEEFRTRYEPISET